MSFLRHEQNYRPISSSARVQGFPTGDGSRPHRVDEFPSGYSLAGCAPEETHLAGKRFRWKIESSERQALPCLFVSP